MLHRIKHVHVSLLLGVFCELQKASEGGAITVEQLLQISRHYRAVIHICVMELQEEDTGVCVCVCVCVCACVRACVHACV